MDGITTRLVESAVGSLDDKAEQLGLARRFKFRAGSRSRGQQHVLEEFQGGVEVGATKIGRSLAEAHAYVTAMNHGLLAVLADRSQQRAEAIAGHARPTYATLTPDGAYHDARAAEMGEHREWLAERVPAEDSTITPM